MIQAVIVMNTQGKPRLTKFYDFQPPEKQQELIRTVYSVLCSRPENVSNFVDVASIFGPNAINVLFRPSCYKTRSLLCSLKLLYSGPNLMMCDVQDSRLVYKHYATLYFVFVYDSAENELAMLDLIQVFVETLDKCFKNVCELDVVFNYSKLHTILDEIIFGGQVLETNSAEIIRVVDEISRLETASASISLVPKSVSSWRR